MQLIGKVMHQSYVYLIKNRVTGQFYYGSRAANVRLKRAPEKDLWIHYYTSSKRVKELIGLYGKDSFDVKILFRHTEYEVCFWYEQLCIRENKGNSLRLNRRYVDPDTGSVVLTTYSETAESKALRIKKMQQTKKGKFNSNGHLGLKHTEETKAKMKVSQAQRNYHHSDEIKKRISEIQKTQLLTMTAEDRKKRWGGCKGKPWSEARRLAQLNRKGKKT